MMLTYQTAIRRSQSMLRVRSIHVANLRIRTTAATNSAGKVSFTTSNNRDDASNHPKPGLVDGVLKWIPSMPPEKKQGESTISSAVEDTDYQHMSTLDWTKLLRRLVDEGDLHGAELTLNKKALRLVSDDHSDWKRKERLDLSAAWVEHQANLVEELYSRHTFPNNEAPTWSKWKISTDLKALIRDIGVACHKAHDILEQAEPIIGARPISSRGEGKEPMTMVDPSVPSACHAVLLAYVRAAKASYYVRHRVRLRGIPQRAQFLYHRMKSTCPPNADAYKLVIETWAYSSEHLRASAAEMMLNEEAEQLKVNKVDPEVLLLLTRAFALSDERRAAYKATFYLQKLLKRLQSEGEQVASKGVPSIEDFRMVLKCWSRSE